MQKSFEYEMILLGTKKHRFYMGAYLVTQKMRSEVWPEKYSVYCNISENNPVENISWYTALGLCNVFSIVNSLQPVYYTWKKKSIFFPGTINGMLSGRIPREVEMDSDADGYRLPTYREYCYVISKYHDDFLKTSKVNELAWYWENTRTPRPVGSKKHDNAEIYDIPGNVNEWLWGAKDYYFEKKESYLGGDHEMRPCMGGSFLSFRGELYERILRHSFKGYSDVGFRLARNYP